MIKNIVLDNIHIIQKTKKYYITPEGLTGNSGK